MSDAGLFSPDFFVARRRFQFAAKRLGWRVESYPLNLTGPKGADLTVEVAVSPTSGTDQAMVVTSGVHGVEGFLGSAIQLGICNRWYHEDVRTKRVRCVFIHGLNPHGFAWLRRFDQNNVDLNRNFLLPDERYAGCHPGYESLNSLLNPPTARPWIDPFPIHAVRKIYQHGLQALKQCVAEGQYEFPRGLFFGGSEPSFAMSLLNQQLPSWLAGCERVIHLDFHTGLGRRHQWKLLLDQSLATGQQQDLQQWFGHDRIETAGDNQTAYDVKGCIGRWCARHSHVPNYIYGCAEFGTYSPLAVLAGLRAENQAHHWNSPNQRVFWRTKLRLKELFCPAHPSWRTWAVEQGMTAVENAFRGLQQDTA